MNTKRCFAAILLILTCAIACSKKGLEPTQPQYVTPEAVDLGLSVEWASCNLGAASPEQTGGFYSWGETQTKSTYWEQDYKFFKEHGFNKSRVFMVVKKYVEVIPRDSIEIYKGIKIPNTFENDFGKVDSLIRLLPEDDAATANLGESWRMPTKDELKELTENCKWEYVTVNGVKGYRVSGKTKGYTDKSIFLPFTGVRSDASYYGKDKYGMYWSSDVGKLLNLQDTTSFACNYDCACFLYLGEQLNNINKPNISYETYYSIAEKAKTKGLRDKFWNYDSRKRGMAIRPVKAK